MTSEQFKTWTEITKNLLTMAGMVLGAFWAWSRFVVERGLMPPSQLDVTLTTIGTTETATLVEVGIQIANKGSSALVVTDLKIRMRYVDDERNIEVDTNDKKPLFGRLRFPHAAVLSDTGSKPRLVKYPGSRNETELNAGEFLVVPYDTFVQPGVNQLYTFITALPQQASYVLILASFRYQLRASKAQMAILQVSRKLGIIQYSLGHINKPHTVERVFRIPDVDVKSDEHREVTGTSLTSPSAPSPPSPSADPSRHPPSSSGPAADTPDET